MGIYYDNEQTEGVVCPSSDNQSSRFTPSDQGRFPESGCLLQDVIEPCRGGGGAYGLPNGGRAVDR